MNTDQESVLNFGEDERHTLLQDTAPAYIETAISNAMQEYPHMAWIVASGPESYRTHRELHPAFFGSFDWHSCVEMHWATIRLLRLFPGLEIEDRARQTLSSLLTPEHIAAETDFFLDPSHRSFERPYGWGWLLKLWHEVSIWDDPDGRFWTSTLAPLVNVIMDHFEAWLTKMTYPQRIGMHSNTAFGLSLAWDAVEAQRPALLDQFRRSSRIWFESDVDYPANYEPSGADFLSAGLCEAVLMAKVLPSDDFAGWLGAFLPGLAQGAPSQIFTPAIVTDATDGQIAHLHGLNLSRAWAFNQLAAHLPKDDARQTSLHTGARDHADVSLDHVVGGDYMTEHWLVAFATLLLSD